MDNKLVSLLIKVGMGVLLLIGVVLIWLNLSIDTSSDEPILDQAFYNETYTLPAEDGKKAVSESIVRYDYVIDNEKGLVYDLTNTSAYEMDAFVESKGKTKTSAGTYATEDVDPVLINQYDLQQATGSSIVYTQWLMYGGLFLILIFTLVNVVKEPKRFLRSAIGTVLLLVIAAICYYSVPTEAEVGSKVLQLDGYTDASYQMTGMGIAMFIALASIAGIMIVVGVLSGALRYFSK